MARKSKKNTVVETIETPVEDIITAEHADAMARFAEGDETALDTILEGEVIAEIEGEIETPEAPEGSDEDQAPVEDPTGEGEEPEEQQTYHELHAAALADEELIEEMRTEIVAGFVDRTAFEAHKGSKDSIYKTLDKSRAKLTQAKAVAALSVCGVSPSFVNETRHEGSAYNVYAVEKLADLVAGLNGDVMRNAINLAVMKSLFQFRAAGEVFTGEMARAAASNKIRVQGQIAKLLVRHTVSSGTAPTQASSTMQAAQTLGIVENKGSQKHPVYALTDSPATRQLERILMAA